MLGMLCALLLGASAMAAEQATVPQQLRDIGIDQKLGARVPGDLLFRDETGQPVRLGSYFGKRPIVLTLVYYNCPMLCTLTLNDTVRAMRAMPLELGRDYDVLTVSFAPAETPELALKKKMNYLESYRGKNAEAAAEGWHFLTGNEDAIHKLTQTVGFGYRYDKEHDQYIHPAGIMILSPEGKITRYFYGIDYNATDLRLSLVEASQNKVGTLAEQVLLLCYHYDPTVGKYTVAVMRILRAGGVVTVLALGSFVWVMLRRERRQRRKVGSGEGEARAAPAPDAGSQSVGETSR